MDVIDLIGQLPVHATLTYPVRPQTQMGQLVLHHTAGSMVDANGNTIPDAEEQTPVSIARYHIKPRPQAPQGWPGIAYHAVIDRFGTIFKCWPATTVTYCVKGENRLSYCVCLIGNRDEMPAPSTQWQAAVEFFTALREGYGAALPILGHREALPGHTACPGRFVDMALFRAAVDAA